MNAKKWMELASETVVLLSKQYKELYSQIATAPVSTLGKIKDKLAEIKEDIDYHHFASIAVKEQAERQLANVKSKLIYPLQENANKVHQNN